ncbi:methyltransferase domain-containing protein [Rhodohalobacter sp. SW132]|uniref:methyltransferase domain-containing protein n=1 Tax=Rhodohalobacter sp. SW132 TaxID=2293433 RepID=UPI000E237FE9|nr:methyltransferase domain-containing protein [Rhodohalobacter sp. SW132]REL29068.1 methyltransferase domain-containing protein [Rhodohalobacter sp. SW132]
MPLFLSERDPGLLEKMDDANCDPKQLTNTYQQFATVNRLLGGWGRIYRKFIHPALNQQKNESALLDIGCGGGDILRALSSFTEKDGLNVQFTGIDPDSRAIEFARKRTGNPKIRYLQQSSSELSERGERYSVVISNHLLHHLNTEDLQQICRDAESLATDLVLFSDIERSDIGYGLFRLIAPILFRNSFIAEDGITSIRRSYRADELREKLPDGWRVIRQFPFRLIAIFDKQQVR